MSTPAIASAGSERVATSAALLAALLGAAAPLAAARPAAAQDTLRLGDLHDAALRQDPRAGQVALRERATDLRMRNLSVERLPRLSVGAEGRYLSDVPSLSTQIPAATVFGPPNEQYRATLSVDQLLYDGGRIGARRDVERARLAEAEAALAVELYGLRGEVNQAFFTAALLRARLREVALLIEDLEARLRETRSRVRAGTALSGDAAAVEAELLAAEQERSEMAANRRAALAVLGELTGMSISAADVLALPELADEVERVRSARAAGSELGQRPEYARFKRSGECLAEEAEVIAAGRLPRAAAFGEVGYGRPGLNLLGGEFDTFWVGGLRIEWSPWRWGTIGREREVIQLERRIVSTRQAAFTERLERRVQDQLAAMHRLQAALETDARIIALRQQTERQTRRRFEEGLITAPAYIDVRTDLFDARVARRLHRIELARARAEYLTTLGVPPR